MKLAKRLQFSESGQPVGFSSYTFTNRWGLFTIILLLLGAVGLLLFDHFSPHQALGSVPSNVDLGQAAEGLDRSLERIQVGEIEATQLSVDYADPETWELSLSYPDASYLKIHFSQFDLPPGDTLSISDPSGNQVYTYPGSPYTTDDGEGFWAISVLGDTLVIRLHPAETNIEQNQHSKLDSDPLASTAASKLVRVSIDKFARGYPPDMIQALFDGTESTCGTEQRTDVVCYQSSHPTEYQKSRAVARLLISNTYLCTGWRASAENRVFTNEHCVTSQGDVNGTEVWFNYDRLVCGSGNTGTPTIVTGNTLLIDNADYDFALFTVNDFETIASFGYLQMDPRPPQLNEEIYIPQHGNGDPKQFGIESDMNTGNVCRIDDEVATGNVANSDTGYYCDTVGGSSGSPVLARSSNKVIALHHFGTGGLPCSSLRMNQGVRMDLIWPLVSSYFDPTAIELKNFQASQIECFGNPLLIGGFALLLITSGVVWRRYRRG